MKSLINKCDKINIDYIFIIIETIFYIVFIYMDIIGHKSTDIKFLTILLCFLFSFYKGRQNDNRIIILPFFFTVLADINLLVLDSNYEIGTGLFCIVQACYAFRILFRIDAIPVNESDDQLVLFPFKVSLRTNKTAALIQFAVRLATYLTALLICADKLDMLTALAMFSYSQLLLNLVFSFITIKSIDKGLIFCLGLLLFFCCDSLVGLHNIDAYIPSFNNNFFRTIHPFISIGMWIFYLPSQVLIALSLTGKKQA